MIQSDLHTRIRKFREEVLELSQAQFAALLGMGVASINRIEGGAEPTPAHQLLLEGLQDPANLVRALEGKEDVLGKANCLRIQKIAEHLLGVEEIEKVAKFQRAQWTRETSGREQFDLEKLVEMVKFFTAEGEWKTKLNKLLFYADFFAYRELGASISGTRYAIGEFGPIPDKQETLYAALIQSRVLKAREQFSSSGSPLEKLFAVGDLNRQIFSLKEIRILERVKEAFRRMTAKQIADYSHEEVFYQEGQLGEPVPYSESKKIREISSLARETAPEQQSGGGLAIGELAAQISSKVAMKEWEKLPSDGSKNIDHHLYGAPKRK